MIRKKNYWLFSIVLLAAAESTYEAGCLKKCKECCCGKLCNKDDENKQNLVNDNNQVPEIHTTT